MLGITTSAQSKSTEKLSSDYKINHAADDAAGLTISEKMRKQVRGLSRAPTNAQDGVSAVQTAEGALTEVHSMLQRMNELAVQAANGTKSEADRKAIQDEVDALSKEIDRVAETTKFNEIYLLKGDENAKPKTLNLKAHDAGLKGQLTDNGNGTATEGTEATATIDLTTNGWTTNGTLTIASVTVTQAAANDVDAIKAALNGDAGFSGKYTADKDASGNPVITANDNSVTKEALTADITDVNMMV